MSLFSVFQKEKYCRIHIGKKNVDIYVVVSVALQRFMWKSCKRDPVSLMPLPGWDDKEKKLGSYPGFTAFVSIYICSALVCVTEYIGHK